MEPPPMALTDTAGGTQTDPGTGKP
ncbi:peptidase, partial [Salmonella enterica]|nr:peptidase [Salmonella enterica subsp. enterica serovar Java]EAR6581217.1 peptidase [Salmonella enterica]EAW1876776.1 peptidase [Salmonella enterica subsp. enterica]ECM6688277.1 peptidase [Salmonella enterica subsp. enterica serovar Enteritidis]ECY7949403.1 peptidase [Salmonella enterica subsp. enterica serovar Thompson]EDU3548420.1 peptidase [Salmonella enterica subsp. enterica serovar Paratyphi B]